MILADWAFILYSVYVPLIIAIYLLELYVIFHHRKTFNSSFYKIFSVLAVVNIAACTFATFVFRMPLYPIVNHLYESLSILDPSNWLAVAYFVTYYLNCLSQFLGVLLAFNRFTSLYFPVLHDYFWRWAIFAGIGVCIIVSVPPVVHLLYFPASFFDMSVSNNGHPFYFLNSWSDGSLASIWFNMAVVTVTCNSLSSLLYGACLVRLCFFSTTRNRSAERNFFIVGFLSMIFSLPYMAGMLTFHLSFEVSHFNFDMMNFIIHQLPWLTDLKFLSPAPVLLITNSSIRGVIKNMFTKAKGNTSTVAVLGSHPKTISSHA